MPSIPPEAAIARLSMRSCKKSVLGCAPNALRTPSSFWRLRLLASNRLATFTQAINNTKPTALSSNQSVTIRSLGMKSFLNGSTDACHPLLVFG